MSAVTKLPDSMVRAWRVYERSLRAAMVASKCTPAEIDHACSVIMPLYLRYATSKKFSKCDPEVLLKELNDWFFEQIFGLLIEVAQQTVLNYRLQGGCDE